MRHVQSQHMRRVLHYGTCMSNAQTKRRHACTNAHTHAITLSGVQCGSCHRVTGINVVIAEWILSWAAFSAGGGGGDRAVSVKQARRRESTSPIRANSKWIRILSDSCLIRFDCMWKWNICFCGDVCLDSLCIDAQPLRISLSSHPMCNGGRPALVLCTRWNSTVIWLPAFITLYSIHGTMCRPSSNPTGPFECTVVCHNGLD